MYECFGLKSCEMPFFAHLAADFGKKRPILSSQSGVWNDIFSFSQKKTHSWSHLAFTPESFWSLLVVLYEDLQKLCWIFQRNRKPEHPKHFLYIINLSATSPFLTSGQSDVGYAHRLGQGRGDESVGQEDSGVGQPKSQCRMKKRSSRIRSPDEMKGFPTPFERASVRRISERICITFIPE